VADCCHPQEVTGVQNSVEAAIIITDKNTSNTTSTPETTTLASSSSSSSSSCLERFQESLLFSTFSVDEGNTERGRESERVCTAVVTTAEATSRSYWMCLLASVARSSRNLFLDR
jgi:hypothetical protein